METKLLWSIIAMIHNQGDLGPEEYVLLRQFAEPDENFNQMLERKMKE